jgi:hypothetical protein
MMEFCVSLKQEKEGRLVESTSAFVMVKREDVAVKTHSL